MGRGGSALKFKSDQMAKLLEIDENPDRIFVVGDIHGCSKESLVLLEHLVQQEKLSESDLVIFVGDYIDRGKDSKGVIEILVQFQSKFPGTIFLKGNHEDMLMDFLGFGGTMGNSFLVNGGADTISSYGISVLAAPEEICDAIPKEHISFLLGLNSYVVCGNFIVAHAGLNPLRDMRAQLDEDLFWIRDQFITNVHYFQKTVIFGHTPYQDIYLNPPYKIGIDTGLVYGNMLTCIELKESRKFQVLAGAKSVRVTKFSTDSRVAAR